MFLNKLNTVEKKSFLELAHHIARSDGEFSEEEQKVIATYCLEMQVQDINYDIKNFNLDSILSKISSIENQKIVFLEIMALVYSDGVEQEEQEILNVMSEKFNIDEALSIVYAEWSKSILAIVNQGQALIRL